MSVIPLSSVDLGIGAGLILALALVTHGLRLGLGRSLFLAALRMTLQLLLIGFILRFLFEDYSLWMLALLSVIMILIAGREVLSRQKIKTTGPYGYCVGVSSMFLSSFTITLFALTAIIEVEPWYAPQYSIPLLGMLLGNTMTGISLSLDRLTTDIYQQRNVIEQRLYLGQTWKQATLLIRQNGMRTGMIPLVNSMAAAGVVSLPGTMTGQILGGSPPLEAVKYQILIFFLIGAGTGFGVIFAIWMTNRNLFDGRHRLRLERFKMAKQ